jgi:hypothetical protein
MKPAATEMKKSVRPILSKGRSKALEDRLRKLESIVDSLHLDEHSQSGESLDELQPAHFQRIQLNVVPASPALSNAPFPAHVDQPRPGIVQ